LIIEFVRADKEAKSPIQAMGLFALIIIFCQDRFLRLQAK